MALPSSDDETARLAALNTYEILDSPPESEFDDLLEVAMALCDVPLGLVSFMAADRHWFKATRGLGDLREISHEVSFCTHALHQRRTLVVPDTRSDPSFRTNPFVTGLPNIRFYAGTPIFDRDGFALGTLSVIDVEPRNPAARQIAALEALARQASSLLDRRRVTKERETAASGREQALRLVHESQEQLELAVDAAGLGVWFFDPLKGIVGGDSTMARFFGLPTAEGPAQVWLNAIVEEDRARVGQEFAASVAGAPYDTTYRVIVDGEVRWLHARAKLNRDADGTVRMVGICDDVTRERVLIATLAETAERLAVAQSASGAMVFEWDVANDAITWGENTAGHFMADLRSAESFFRAVPEEDREPLQMALDASLKSGEIYHHDFRMRSPEGETLWYHTSGRPIFDVHSHPVKVIGANFDITGRKRAEAALLRSEKLAAVGRLASAVAHEINNPLEAVTNLLYLSRSRVTGEDEKAWLDQADRELRRVSAIASQTLRFHRQSTNPQPITCLSLFSTTLEMYEARLVNSGIVVEKRKRANEPVMCFESDVRQVLSNVVTNAIDAMPNGGRLIVRSREGTDWRSGRRGLLLTVADTGAGMSPQVRSHAFEAFFTTKGIGGSGLGLWISEEIMNRHQGRITLRSSSRERLHGTAVVLFLPFNAVPVSRRA